MTWAEFVAVVREHLTVHNKRLGIQDYVLRQIKNGVRDIQVHAPFYQGGHETVYQEDDVTAHGMASVAAIPEKAFPVSLEVQKVGDRCAAQPFSEYPYGNVRDLLCGSVTMKDCRFFVSFDDHGETMTVFPKIDSGHQLVLIWDGVKDDFADGETVPFDNDVAQAVAEWVLWKLTPEIDKTPGLGKVHHDAYLSERRKIIRLTRDRTRFRRDTTTPDEANAACANQGSLAGCLQAGTVNSQDAQVEAVLFGDSGELSTIADTIAVASLLNVLDPDVFIHLGDANYPSGSVTTLQDYFTEHYYGWLPDSAFFVWGNHDEADDGSVGDAFFDLMPHLLTRNAGKKYYSFTQGLSGEQPLVEFFVLHYHPWELDDQEAWLDTAIAASTAIWKVVLNHRAPYTSDVTHRPGYTDARLDYKSKGIHLVISAHGHNYERLLVDELPYLVAGLGGATKRAFGAVVAGSQFRYNAKNGLLKLTVTPTKLESSFINTDKVVIDQLILKQ